MGGTSSADHVWHGSMSGLQAGLEAGVQTSTHVASQRVPLLACCRHSQSASMSAPAAAGQQRAGATKRTSPLLLGLRCAAEPPDAGAVGF